MFQKKRNKKQTKYLKTIKKKYLAYSNKYITNNNISYSKKQKSIKQFCYIRAY